MVLAGYYGYVVLAMPRETRTALSMLTDRNCYVVQNFSGELSFPGLFGSFWTQEIIILLYCSEKKNIV